ncbi:MAG: cation-translocating P-type ATPase [Chloroflexi bacterium]|jgi:Cd2+/Zn2+-exporting ATPase|nr:cation-translocating P-type ATPase [Chloroflexota bacterium]
MAGLKTRLQDIKQRRELLLITSGSLIIAALAATHLFSFAAAGRWLYAAAAIAAGWDIALRAWNSLRNRHVSIELLVTIAASGALLIGEVWEAAAVTFLFILGAYLEARTLTRTRKVLEELLDLAPMQAVVIRDGRELEVAPYEVAVGETVLVRPGGRIPVDGEVIDGRSVVDESAITGEPMPEVKTAGATVFAGTINQEGLLWVRATGVGADTTLARIIRRVEEAQEEKAPTQRFIERFARWYTPFIIALSAVAFLITRNVELALTLLVIGCPGALVISTPVSVVAGIGRAAQRGILIKGGEYLENSGKISIVALDKTGTITRGRPQVTEIIALQNVPQLASAVVPAGETAASLPDQAASVLYWAAIAEGGSEHPLARAVRLAAEEQFGPLPPADEFETFTGKGVRAVYGNVEILVGNQEFLQEMEVTITSELQEHLRELRSRGHTAVAVALNGQPGGVLGISDPLRESSPSMIRKLREAGVRRIVMLTGDDELTARAIAAEAGIEEVRASLLPEEKLDAIRELQRSGQVVAMVGDGINDAPALAAADIGIAMGAGGTDVAIETADIALIADDLHKIPEAIRISRATMRNIRQNVVVALATVTLLLAGVLLGEVHMAGGMLVHEASVLLVILNGMRLLRI